METHLAGSEIADLVKIADGSVKERRRHWYTLGIPVNHRYTLDEQMDAIKQLGRSGSYEALDYLEDIVQPRDRVYHTGLDRDQVERTHPFASGQLHKTLRKDGTYYLRSCQFEWDESSLYDKTVAVIQEAVDQLRLSHA